MARTQRAGIAALFLRPRTPPGGALQPPERGALVDGGTSCGPLDRAPPAGSRRPRRKERRGSRFPRRPAGYRPATSAAAPPAPRRLLAFRLSRRRAVAWSPLSACFLSLRVGGYARRTRASIPISCGCFVLGRSRALMHASLPASSPHSPSALLASTPIRTQSSTKPSALLAPRGFGINRLGLSRRAGGDVPGGRASGSGRRSAGWRGRRATRTASRSRSELRRGRSRSRGSPCPGGRRLRSPTPS